MWWRGKYQGLRRVVGAAIALVWCLTYDFTHIVNRMSSELLRGMDLMTVEVNRARVWMCSPCVYNLRCENEGATTDVGIRLVLVCAQPPPNPVSR